MNQRSSATALQRIARRFLRWIVTTDLLNKTECRNKYLVISTPSLRVHSDARRNVDVPGRSQATPPPNPITLCTQTLT